jgi:hypothetical protein
MPVIPATQEDGGSKPAWVNSFVRPYLEKTLCKKRLVEWLKVKALSSRPSTTKKKKKKREEGRKKKERKTGLKVNLLCPGMSLTSELAKGAAERSVGERPCDMSEKVHKSSFQGDLISHGDN